jgi:branched-subunit amino acid transport protein
VADLWLLVIAGSIVTYMWRALGVLLSGRIKTDTDLFNWVACVAYAMVAGLIMRIVVLPTGLLAATLLGHRLIACALALAAFYACRRNLFVAVVVGALTLTLLNYLRMLAG